MRCPKSPGESEAIQSLVVGGYTRWCPHEDIIDLLLFNISIDEENASTCISKCLSLNGKGRLLRETETWMLSWKRELRIKYARKRDIWGYGNNLSKLIKIGMY